ncbi:MAG TPA: hypothetical protein VFL80_09140, partial [Thermoanaerobaculia bacterium]|nr:hypothetical protein [Thermoanaerobaculia bacterium]
MRAAVVRFPIASFTSAAFAISWAIWLALLIGSAVPPRTALLIYYAGVIGPAAAAFLCCGAAPLLARIRRWRVAAGWYCAAGTLPFLIRGL